MLNMMDIKETCFYAYNFFDKKLKGSGVANNEIKQNLQLAKMELHKPIIKKF